MDKTEDFIAIPKSEYDFLLSCKNKLSAIYEKDVCDVQVGMQSEMTNSLIIKNI